MSRTLVQILLVEDHPSDVMLARKAFCTLDTPVNLSVVLDGVQAMNFLRQQGRYAHAPRPDLVILDLNMPRMNGREVLQEIHQEADLKTIPVIILTTSSAERDVLESYALCANSYLVKPTRFEDFQKLIQLLERYWLEASEIP